MAVGSIPGGGAGLLLSVPLTVLTGDDTAYAGHLGCTAEPGAQLAVRPGGWDSGDR